MRNWTIHRSGGRNYTEYRHCIELLQFVDVCDFIIDEIKNGYKKEVYNETGYEAHA